MGFFFFLDSLLITEAAIICLFLIMNDIIPRIFIIIAVGLSFSAWKKQDEVRLSPWLLWLWHSRTLWLSDPPRQQESP